LPTKSLQRNAGGSIFSGFVLVYAELVHELIAVIPQPPAATGCDTTTTQNDKNDNDNNKRSIILLWFFERGCSHIFVHFLFSFLDY
jgi:hypothetical protein